MLATTLEDNPPLEIADRVHLRLASFLLMKDESKLALAQVQAVLKNPNSAVLGEAVHLAGECAIQTKDWPGAIAQLVNFRDKDPFRNMSGVTERGLLRLGFAFAQAQRWDESRQAYEALIQRFGQSSFVPEARFEMGTAFLAANQHDNAYANFAEVPKRTAAEIAARAQLQMGMIRLTQKKFPEALKDLLTAASIYEIPEVSAEALCEAGVAQLELKQPAEATKLWQSVIADHPTSKWGRDGQEASGWNQIIFRTHSERFTLETKISEIPLKRNCRGRAAFACFQRPASGYVEIQYALGKVLAESTNVLLIVVESVDKTKNTIIYKKVRDIKASIPAKTIKHLVGQAGFEPREWQGVMAWAEPGKMAVMFHNGAAAETCIDNYWYQTPNAGEWWNMTHAEPFMLRTYCGKPEKLAVAIAAMLAGQEVVVPSMVDGDKNALKARTAKMQRLKASAKIQDYNDKRDFVDFGSGGDELRPIAACPDSPTRSPSKNRRGRHRHRRSRCEQRPTASISAFTASGRSA